MARDRSAQSGGQQEGFARQGPRRFIGGCGRLDKDRITVAEPARAVEQITDQNWTEHLRRFHRTTAADVALGERRIAFQEGEEPPVVSRYLAER